MGATDKTRGAPCFEKWQLLGELVADVRSTSKVSVAVVGLVALVTLLAGYLPAWRAAVLNPLEVLKAE